MEDRTAQIQPQDTLSLSHTHLHTSPIRPDDCLGARWHSTRLSLSLSPFSCLHSLPLKHKLKFVACYTSPPKHAVAPGPAQTGLFCPPLIPCCTHKLQARTNCLNLILTLAHLFKQRGREAVIQDHNVPAKSENASCLCVL